MAGGEHSLLRQWRIGAEAVGGDDDDDENDACGSFGVLLMVLCLLLIFLSIASPVPLSLIVNVGRTPTGRQQQRNAVVRSKPLSWLGPHEHASAPEDSHLRTTWDWAVQEGARLSSLHCSLIYIDCGANKGDSLEDLVNGKVDDLWLGMLLQRATGHPWSARMLPTTCVQAFEMNPRHTEALKAAEQTYRPRLLDLRVHTETALMADASKQVFVSNDNDAVIGKPDGIMARAVNVPAHGTPRQHLLRRGVQAINLAAFLGGLTRGLKAPALPIVVRMDIEGTEYAVLRDLAASGAARSRRSPIWLCIEWHRFAKHTSVSAEELDLMQRLDRSMAHFNRAGNGSNTPASSAGSLWAASSLLQNYEKEMVLRLAAANFLTFESSGAFEEWQRAQRRPLTSGAPRRAVNTTGGRTAGRNQPLTLRTRGGGRGTDVNQLASV